MAKSPRAARLELREQRQRVVRGDEVEGETGLDDPEGTEDRGVPDGVRNGAGVEHDVVGVFVAAGAAGCVGQCGRHRDGWTSG